MKRLHLVGRSKDDKRLILSKTRGAKFGSFEVPISPKLLKVIREVDEDREPKKPAAAAAAAPAAESGAAASQAGPAATFQQATGLEGAGRAAATGRSSAPPAPPPEPEPEPAKGRRKKQKAPDSKLSAAEIQSMLRAGSSVASVARLAKAPPWWIKRLGEPIKQERVGAIAQMLQARTVRARLGVSGEPVGRAIVENLRDRGVPFPERAIEGGFSAQRLESGAWRITLRYDHRGRRSARWTFEPHRREVEPLNAHARELAWRTPPRSAMAVMSVEEAEPASGTTGPRRRATARRKTSSRARKRTSTRKTTARKTTRKATTRKPTRKTSARKTTTRKRATSRTRSTRSRRKS